MDDFLKHIEEHRHEFYAHIYKAMWDTGVADDVFSESVLAAYKSRNNFKPGTNFRAWMYRIITNKCFVANRETARTTESLDEATTCFAALDDGSSYVDIIDEPCEFLEKCGDEVNMAFRKLSTAERSSVLLKSVAQLSYKDIAGILDIPTATVMTHLARGRTKLRSGLLDYAREEGFIRKPLIAFNQVENKNKTARCG